jgi:hypothetical protein
MILMADSTAARQSNRCKTGNGWLTTFIGENRNTLRAGDAVPEPGTLYPMAFLVEKEAGAVVKPHFHQADQFQVVVQGSGRLGLHDVGCVAVHYTDPFSAYGPILASNEGVAWFTLRNSWDSGAQYMPAQRDKLRAARARFQHRESTAAPLPPLSDEALSRLEATECKDVLEATPDGMGSWRYRLPRLGAVTGPDPAQGGGQFWLVLAGSAAVPGSALLPVQSCLFAGPSDAPLTRQAGEGGAEVLCLQFPLLARHN